MVLPPLEELDEEELDEELELDEEELDEEELDELELEELELVVPPEPPPELELVGSTVELVLWVGSPPKELELVAVLPPPFPSLKRPSASPGRPPQPIAVMKTPATTPREIQ